MSEISKEEKERQRSAMLEEMRKKLAAEWGDQSVKIPKMLYGYLNLYQFMLPLVIPIFITWGFFYLITYYSVPLLYQILLFPVVIFLDYASYLFFMGIFCGWLVDRWARISPPAEGVFRRSFKEKDVEDPRIKYYHARGFLYKWPVFSAKKSIFPWMGTYMLRKVGKNKIHRDAQYLDNYVALEFTDLQEQFFAMYACTLSSHVVDSLYGNLSIKTVVGEKYATLQPHGVLAPGVKMKQKTVVFPFLIVPKDVVVEKLYNFPHGVKYEYNGLESIVPSDMREEWENRKKKLEKYMN